MTIRGTFFFDPQDRIYADHFPGRAIVPGSLIVHAFLEVGKKAGIGTEGCMIEDFRFREFIAPGSYEYSLERRGDGMRCLLSHEGRTAASGLLRFFLISSPCSPPPVTGEG